MHKAPEEDSAVWDIIRGWCGTPVVEAFDELSDLRADYERLQRLMNETVSWLKVAGHPVKAALLRRRIHPE